jgi:hypothetical protein
LPLVVHVGEHGTDEADDGNVVGATRTATRAAASAVTTVRKRSSRLRSSGASFIAGVSTLWL